MNCEVHGVYKNLRYRILVIDDQIYILDLGRSIWKIVFPFFFWMFPNTIFKVENHETVEKLRAPEVKQTSTGGIGILGGGIAVLIANLLRPLTDYFDIQSSSFVNSIIVMISVIMLVSLRFYINHLNKKNLYKVVNLEQLSTERLWIRPKPFKHFSLVLGMYLFFLAFTVMLFVAFIEFPNVMILFITMILLLFVLFASSITVAVGYTTVKFKGGKKAAS
ncbi:DUF443 domain-containing protein [Virgibacillus natechei]